MISRATISAWLERLRALPYWLRASAVAAVGGTLAGMVIVARALGIETA